MKDDYIDWVLHVFAFQFLSLLRSLLKLDKITNSFVKWSENTIKIEWHWMGYPYSITCEEVFFLSFFHSFVFYIPISVGVQWMIDREQSTFFPLDLSIAWKIRCRIRQWSFLWNWIKVTKNLCESVVGLPWNVNAKLLFLWLKQKKPESKISLIALLSSLHSIVCAEWDHHHRKPQNVE